MAIGNFHLMVRGADYGYYHKINHAIRAMYGKDVAHIRPNNCSTNIFNKNDKGIYLWTWWMTPHSTMGNRWMQISPSDKDVDWRW